MSNNKIKYYEINYFISYFQIIIIYQIKKNMKSNIFLNYFKQFYAYFNLI